MSGADGGASVRAWAPGLAVEGACVRFGSTRALDRVSLAVAPGEVVTLLGPSGCGKSTLLRAVAGLQPLDAGAVRWNGTDLTGVPVHRRGFGLMFQDGQLFVHRDVAGNVAFGLEMAGVNRAARAPRVAALLDLVGLSGFEERAVGTLSGGEQQRVALARALAPGPRLLLLDEPLSALDRALRERLSAELAAILRAAGTTALYVTHDHDEAFAVADRVAVMAGGRILQVDDPARLWRAPASRTVAQFLGYAVFLPVLADDGAPALLAVAPAAARVAAAAPLGRDAATRGGPLPFAFACRQGVEGEIVATRSRRGGAEADVLLPDGQVLAAALEGGGAATWLGRRVLVELDPQGVVLVPPGSVESQDAERSRAPRGYDRRP